ncbi:MAG: carbohydrate ABC transporter permease [Chloroflexi bacterium]|nr:carbohydrate ABC transporter permease [Chloroflexota bacterium]
MKRLLQFFQNGSNQRAYLQDEAYKFIGLGTLFMVLLGLAAVYLSPLLYMGSTALKSEAQLADPDDPLLPQSPQTYHYVSEETQTFRYTYRHPRTFEYEGRELAVYEVIAQGRILNYALLEDRGDSGVFIDPENPDAGPIEMANVTPSGLKAAVEREQLEVQLYFVDVNGVEQQLGLVDEFEDGSTLWVNPENVGAEPMRLPISKDDARLVRDERDLPLYHVPIDGETRELALLEAGRRSTTFIDPDNPDELIVVEERARGLDPVYKLELHPENFKTAIDTINYPRLFANTLIVAVVGGFGAMASATLVAYGFTRFNIPYGNLLFLILLSTIILPPQVTQIPTYIIFRKLGWIGTLLPLIVPFFFSNAYNVFLLRQYMMGIPLELDEAARVDGANPLRILWHVIIPTARPALVAVYLFHFLWAWNEFQQPLIYIGGNENNQVLAVGLQRFSQIYSSQQHLMMAAGVLTMFVPLLIFFLAQRIFMQGVVITGVEK